MKRVIEFDDKGLGCKYCPYFRSKSSEEIFAENGCFCSKESPWKKISYYEDSLDGLVKTPEWCNLPVPKTIPLDKVRSLQAPSIINPPTVRLISQFQTSRFMEDTLTIKDLNAIVKQNIARSIACNEAFQEEIEFKEMESFCGGRVFRGELEIVKNKKKWKQ